MGLGRSNPGSVNTQAPHTLHLSLVKLMLLAGDQGRLGCQQPL